MASKNANLRVENMNPCVKEMEYAVRGPLVIRATALQGEMDQVKLSYPSTLTLTLGQSGQTAELDGDTTGVRDLDHEKYILCNSVYDR